MTRREFEITDEEHAMQCLMKAIGAKWITGLLAGCMAFFMVCQTGYADTGQKSRTEAASTGEEIIHRRVLDLSGDIKVKKPKRKSVRGSSGELPEITDQKYWNAFSSRYYYQDLSADEKKFYDAYCDSLNEFLITDLDAYQIQSYNEDNQMITLYASRKVDVPATVSDEKLDEIATLVEYENPQYFFHFSYAAHTTDGTRVDYVYPVILEEFRSGSTRAEAAYQIMEAASDYLEAAEGAGSVLEKETIIHNKMIENICYKYDENGDTDWGNLYQTSASTFLFGTTVCAGYAKGFSMLMNALGVPTVAVTSLSHAWNEVMIDGGWYNVDVTWDDKDKNTGLDATAASQSARQYFNISDATMRSRDGHSYYMHVPEYFYTIRPACSKDYAVPKPVTLKLKKVAAGQMKVTGSTSGEIQGYQISYKVGTKEKTVAVATRGVLSKKITKLTKGKTVKARIRTYLVILGEKNYSAWTAYRKVKV